MTEVVMPRLSDSMEEGTIIQWLKAEGDHVTVGDALVEIETDKAIMTYEADTAGTLAILAQDGETLPVGHVIAHVGDGSAEPARGATAVGSKPPADLEAGAPVTATPNRNGAPASDDPPDRSPVGTQVVTRVNASPLAKRVANARGVDLATLQGSGPGGRIVKADVEADVAAFTSDRAGARDALAETPSSAKGATTSIELSRVQQVIARRMSEAKATIPEFAISTSIDMSAAVELRARWKQATQIYERAATPSFNDMVVRASAIALSEHPRANGSYRDGTVELYSRVNVGVAVASEESLTVPTVFDADQKSLTEIARETRELATRVRAGTIAPPELAGGTFTVSNLGMYGVTRFAAIINPPQAAILAVGSMNVQATPVDGSVAIRNVLEATLTSDHRVLYGADAAQFLARIKQLLEHPLALVS